jgi:hypothetical protein
MHFMTLYSLSLVRSSSYTEEPSQPHIPLQDENIAPAALGTIGEKEVEAMVDQGAASASAVMVVPVEQSEEDQRIVLLPVQQEMARVSRSGRTIAKSSRFSSYVTD